MQQAIERRSWEYIGKCGWEGIIHYNDKERAYKWQLYKNNGLFDLAFSFDSLTEAYEDMVRVYREERSAEELRKN